MTAKQANDSEGEQVTTKRLRTTVVIEAANEEDFEWALGHAIKLARAHVIQMSLHKEDDPLTRYSVRTATARKRKQRG